MADRSGVELRAVTMGRMAAEVLAMGSLCVTAVFERSFYAEDSGGRLVCFLWPGAEPGPLHVVCDDWVSPAVSGLTEGVTLETDAVGVGMPGYGVTIENCPVWVPPDFPVFDSVLLRRGVRRLGDLLLRRAPRDTLLFRVLSGQAVAAGDPVGAAFYDEAVKGLSGLRRLVRGEGGAEDAVFLLLGLGPGLTPSGDDILAGAALALNALGEGDCLRALCDGFGAVGEVRTNRISWAHLMAAGSGQAVCVFHDLLCDVLSGGDGLGAIVSRIGGVGHSSGWDCALGIYHTLIAFLDARQWQ